MEADVCIGHVGTWFWSYSLWGFAGLELFDVSVGHLPSQRGACQRDGHQQNSRTGRAVTSGGALGPPSVGARNWWTQSMSTSSRVGAQAPTAGKAPETIRVG